MQRASYSSLLDLFNGLMELLTPDGIQASSHELFHGAIFGRDSERVALDLVPWFDSLSARIIFSLVRFQGRELNPVTEEEPGRIHHEYRHLYVGGRKVGKRQEELLRELSRLWGGNEKEMIYYGTVDATPQLVRLVAAHCKYHGPAILDDEFIHRRGVLLTIRESMLDALAWITDRISRSELGFVEFKHQNPHGIKWQAMRDGRLSYLHADGTLANSNDWIASIEVQALAYDALLAGAEMFITTHPEQAKGWQETAECLKRNIFKHFWMPEEQYFAMAIDRDSQGKPRLVRTITSLPAELLETRIFDTLSEEEARPYITAIIKQMYDREFLTEVGIRSRALRYANLLPLWDYQGSNVSWTVMTNIFSLGLRKQGFHELAEDMENRIINAARISQSLLEFFYVDNDGMVIYRPSVGHGIPAADQEAISQSYKIVGTNLPEDVQAWTLSALLSCILRQEQPVSQPETPVYWRQELEQSVLTEHSKTPRIDEQEANSRIGGFSTSYVAREEAMLLEKEVLQRHGYLD